ncbi:MAG: GGDEF domain-containing protein [Alphaproteobacteria bacterium]|nr:GGDEF domain-containing protein [Alphaproteobacteria bacterium]
MPQSSLAEIEDAIAKRRYLDRFLPALEADFEARTANYERRLVRLSLWPTIVTYNAFLAMDIVLLPQTLVPAVILHVLVTLLVVAVTAIYQRTSAVRNRRWMVAAIPLAMITQIMIIYQMNKTDISHHYQYLAIMVVVYSNITQRLGSDFSRFVSVGGATIYLAFLLAADTPVEIVMLGCAMMGAAGYLTTVANMRMQSDARFAFLQRLREELMRHAAEQQSMHDPLTKLQNRRFLQVEAQRLWHAATEAPCAVAVLLLDIDNFKLFNDTYGHASGDTCLQHVARILAEAVADTQHVAIRFGGEEFLILAAGADADAGWDLAERVRLRIEATGIRHAANLPAGVVTASLGVGTGMAPAVRLEDLIAQADAALYDAKRAGRNRTCLPRHEARLRA